MYRKIIIGHDLHDGGSDALALGRLIAEASGAKLVVAGVFPMGILPHGFAQQWREQEEGIAAEIQAIADEAGAEPEAFPSSSPGRGLHDLAEESGADLVVIGSSRHSKVGEIVAGNVGLGLLHGAPCAVAIAPRGYRDRAPGTLGPITVGFDGSEESGLALQDAIELAGASGVEIKLVAVAQLPPIVYGKGGGSGGGYQELEQAIEEHLRTELDEAAEPPQKLKRIAADTDANWIQDSLAWVDRDGQVVHTGEGQQLNFDALLIAVGARQIQAYEHVRTFSDAEADETYQGVLQDIAGGYSKSIAFLLPEGPVYPPPIYELAW